MLGGERLGLGLKFSFGQNPGLRLEVRTKLNKSETKVLQAPPTDLPTIPGTTASLTDQAAQVNEALNTRNAELAEAEELGAETEKVKNKIDEITGGGGGSRTSKIQRHGHMSSIPTDCPTFMATLDTFNAAIGNNPREANVTKGLQIAQALSSVDQTSITCNSEEVSSLLVMREVTVITVASVVKEVVNIKKIEINTLIVQIQEINENLSEAGFTTVPIAASTHAVSPTKPPPQEQTEEATVAEQEPTGQYPVSMEGESTGQYPVSMEGGSTGQYPVSMEGGSTGQYPVSMEGGSTGQYPVSMEGGSTGQYPVSMEGESTGQYPVSMEGGSTGQYPVSMEGGSTGQYPVSLEGGSTGQYPATMEGESTGQYPGSLEGESTGQYPGSVEGESTGQYPATITMEGESTGQDPVSMEGGSTGQYPVTMEGESTGQYPVSMEGESTGQYPVTIDGGDYEATGQYPVTVEVDSTGQYPVPVEGEFNKTTGQYPVEIEGGSTGQQPIEVSLADQAANANEKLNTKYLELADAEYLGEEIEKILITIDAIIEEGDVTIVARVKRQEEDPRIPSDCPTYINVLNDFSTAIGNNPRTANVTEGILIAQTLSSVEPGAIRCSVEEVSSLEILREITVETTKKVVKEVVNFKKIEINYLIMKIQEINNNLSEAGMPTVSIEGSTFAVSPTMESPGEEYPGSGYGEGSGATGQYPVPFLGQGNQTTGQFPIPFEANFTKNKL